MRTNEIHRDPRKGYNPSLQKPYAAPFFSSREGGNSDRPGLPRLEPMDSPKHVPTPLIPPTIKKAPCRARSLSRTYDDGRYNNSAFDKGRLAGKQPFLPKRAFDPTGSSWVDIISHYHLSQMMMFYDFCIFLQEEITKDGPSYMDDIDLMPRTDNPATIQK